MEKLDLLFVFVTALAGGFLPLLVRWDGRRLHLALALSTGIFLGAVFLHLLPSLPSLPPPTISVQVGLVWQGGNGVDDLLRDQVYGPPSPCYQLPAPFSHPSLEEPGSPKVLPMESEMAIFCLLARQTDRCYLSWILMGTF